MDLQAVNVLVASAIDGLRTELQTSFNTSNTVLKTALDKEFDAVRAEAVKATAAVKTTFEAADAQVREDQKLVEDRLKKIESEVEDFDLQQSELKDQLQLYENQQVDKESKAQVDMQNLKDRAWLHLS